jgi:tricorn protease
MARRVTSFQGQTSNPHFSPDGKWIAFSGEYAGNLDVYVVSADGGEPKRLTWHPGADNTQGWTPDGKSIMFSSSRATWSPSGAPRFWTGAGYGRRRGTDGPATRLSGKDLRRWIAHRVSHEQLLGR